MNTFQTRHTQWVICSCCAGNGTVDNPAFANGFTQEQWEEMGQDWDGECMTTGQDRYLAGVYDVTCTHCSGTGKVREPVFKEMPRPERRSYIKYLREQREQVTYAAATKAEYEAERRIGA